MNEERKDKTSALFVLFIPLGMAVANVLIVLIGSSQEIYPIKNITHAAAKLSGDLGLYIIFSPAVLISSALYYYKFKDIKWTIIVGVITVVVEFFVLIIFLITTFKMY